MNQSFFLLDFFREEGKKAEVKEVKHEKKKSNVLIVAVKQN